MPKKQKAFSLSSEIMTFIGIFIVIVACFLFLVPKVASTLFPWKRNMILSDFLKTVQSQKTIPAQEFWKFREFYSPGYYTFNKTGLSVSEIASAEQFIHVPLQTMKGEEDIFLSFTSPHLHSIEALVQENSLEAIIPVSTYIHSRQMLSTPNEKIWKDANGQIYIVFLKPLSQMQTANGYFDYMGVDKQLTMGKYWLDITELDGK